MLFGDEDSFLLQLCLMIGDALDIPEETKIYWQSPLTNIVKCSNYISKYIIPKANAPIVLAMDEVENILTSPFRDDFFAMLRTWHNDRAYDENFARLSMILSSSTEPYLFVDNPNHSPFNVAELITLKDFTRPEVEELNRRHNLPLTDVEIHSLMDLVGGHPFLIRLALYLVATGKYRTDNLLTHATDEDGPFGDHLRHYLLRVLQKKELKEALIHICRYHTYEENQTYHRLKGAGLVKREGQQVSLRNNLYTRYFEERLNV